MIVYNVERVFVALYRGSEAVFWLLASPLLTAGSVVNGHSVAISLMETHMSVCTTSIHMAQTALLRGSDWFLVFLWLFQFVLLHL